MDEKVTINGPFEETATFAQILKTAFRRGRNWEALSHDAKEALEQTATSIARILNGDANEGKHWDRAAGYLKLRAAAINDKLEGEVTRTATERLREPYQPTMKPRTPEEEPRDA
jgi:hypothetical protein